MSFDALKWAMKEQVPPTLKLVLIMLANFANSDLKCWPSIERLCDETGLNRKTVQTNLNKLRECGYIEDAGERRGRTKQVIVYRLNTSKIGSFNELQKRDSNKGNKTNPYPKKKMRVKIDPKEAKSQFKDVQSRRFEEDQNLLETIPKVGYGTNKNHKEKESLKESLRETRVAQSTRLQTSLNGSKMPSKTNEREASSYVPYREIVDLYNALLPECRRVIRLTENRKAQLLACWNNSPAHQSLDSWHMYFLDVSASDFLMGKITRWKADFDWLTEVTNFVSVINGRFANKLWGA